MDIVAITTDGEHQDWVYAYIDGTLYRCCVDETPVSDMVWNPVSLPEGHAVRNTKPMDGITTAKSILGIAQNTVADILEEMNDCQWGEALSKLEELAQTLDGFEKLPQLQQGKSYEN